jgi:30S ribosomal protein S31
MSSGTGAFLFSRISGHPSTAPEIRRSFVNHPINQINQFMGRGDKKTKKGKIFKGSFGKSRPRKKKKPAKTKGTP